MSLLKKIEISYKLRWWRGMFGYSQKELSYLVGCRPEVMSRWEKCHNYPSIKYREILERLGIMDAPYHLCCINGCSKIGEVHHEPPRSQLAKEDYGKPKYHRHLCRQHHRERHDKPDFNKNYPEYYGITLEEYRREQRASSTAT